MWERKGRKTLLRACVKQAFLKVKGFEVLNEGFQNIASNGGLSVTKCYNIANFGGPLV
jgi:hypothetical protein